MTPRWGRLARVLRDLGAVFAFLAVFLSGSIPLPVTLAFGAAVAASLWGLRPFSGRAALSAVALLLLAFALFGLAFRGLLDLVVAAVSFAALVASHRMLSDETARTDLQVHLAALLLIAGGAAVSGELFYAPCLFGFAACATTSLGLQVVAGEAQDALHVPLGRVLRPLGGGFGWAVLGAVAFFVLFPRLSWNMAARRAPPGLGGTTGMSDRVRLGGGGDLKTSPRVVARVALDPDPGTETLGAYFPGRTFDTFEGSEWRGSGTALPPAHRVTLREVGPGQVLQSIELLPAYGARTLIALDEPTRLGPATALTASGSGRTQLVEVTDEEVRFADGANAYSYQAWSQPDARRRVPEVLTDVLRYTRLPREVDPRVHALAKELAGDTQDPAVAAQRITEHLQTRYAYTLELPGEVQDPLADFLFERRMGHCEHFATAGAVLLRSLGFASRVTAGFYGGERLGGVYVLRAGDAHAWVQVWAPGRGWLTFDPTPAEGRSSRPQRLWARIVDWYEELEALWRARVVDYSFRDQFLFVRGLVRPPRQVERAPDAPRDGPGRLPAAAWLVAAGAAGLVFWLLARRGRRRGPPPHPAAGFLDALEAALRRAGVPRLPGEGVEELAARLGAQKDPAAPPVRAAVRRYLEARFGGRPLAPGERRQLLDAVARAPRREESLVT